MHLTAVVMGALDAGCGAVVDGEEVSPAGINSSVFG